MTLIEQAASVQPAGGRKSSTQSGLGRNIAEERAPTTTPDAGRRLEVVTVDVVRICDEAHPRRTTSTT